MVGFLSLALVHHRYCYWMLYLHAMHSSLTDTFFDNYSISFNYVAWRLRVKKLKCIYSGKKAERNSFIINLVWNKKKMHKTSFSFFNLKFRYGHVWFLMLQLKAHQFNFAVFFSLYFAKPSKNQLYKHLQILIIS